MHACNPTGEVSPQSMLACPTSQGETMSQKGKQIHTQNPSTWKAEVEDFYKFEKGLGYVLNSMLTCTAV